MAYIKITPHKEFELIKAGNKSAALSLGGALVSLSISLAFCLSGSVSVFDVMIWGAVILTLQIAVFFMVDFF